MTTNGMDGISGTCLLPTCPNGIYEADELSFNQVLGG